MILLFFFASISSLSHGLFPLLLQILCLIFWLFSQVAWLLIEIFAHWKYSVFQPFTFKFKDDLTLLICPHLPSEQRIGMPSSCYAKDCTQGLVYDRQGLSLPTESHLQPQEEKFQMKWNQNLIQGIKDTEELTSFL